MEDECHHIVPEVILDESSSQECRAPASSNDITPADSSSHVTHEFSLGHVGRGSASRSSSRLDSVDQRTQPLKGHAANSVLQDADTIDLTRYEDSSMDEAEDDQSTTDADYQCSSAGDRKCSRMDANTGAQSNVASVRKIVSFAEALNSISGTCTCCKQRRLIQEQFLESLRLETELLRQRLRNEARRGELLEHKLREHAPKREPHMSPRT